MVFGPTGQPGLHAQRLVVEVGRQEKDPAMEECRVVEAVRLETVMNNVVVRYTLF